MKFHLSLKHLEKKDVVMEGNATAEDLDLGDVRDDLVKIKEPIQFKLTATRLQESILVEGRVEMVLDCCCARCLEPFTKRMELDPWTSLIVMEGEEGAVVRDDSVDLTPYLREDIVLMLPQHPLCKPECRGLPVATIKTTDSAGLACQDEKLTTTSAWLALDQLKLQ